jgi:hypothetical protein
VSRTHTRAMKRRFCFDYIYYCALCAQSVDFEACTRGQFGSAPREQAIHLSFHFLPDARMQRMNSQQGVIRPTLNICDEFIVILGHVRQTCRDKVEIHVTNENLFTSKLTFYFGHIFKGAFSDTIKVLAHDFSYNCFLLIKCILGY